MADTLRVPAPRRVTALYVVLTSEPIGDATTAPPLPPASLLLARGASPDDADRMDSLPYATAVVLESDVDSAFEGERRAQASACALADEHDGIVLDSSVPRLIDGSGARSNHLRSTDWFVFEHLDDEILTHGLARFGLPELRCGDVPAEQLPMYDAVLVGVAQRVVEEWPANDPVGPATVTMRDIARGYGDPWAGGDDPTLVRKVDVTLTFDPDLESLDVALHDDPATALFAD